MTGILISDRCVTSRLSVPELFRPLRSVTSISAYFTSIFGQLVAGLGGLYLDYVGSGLRPPSDYLFDRPSSGCSCRSDILPARTPRNARGAGLSYRRQYRTQGRQTKPQRRVR